MDNFQSGYNHLLGRLVRYLLGKKHIFHRSFLRRHNKAWYKLPAPVYIHIFQNRLHHKGNNWLEFEQDYKMLGCILPNSIVCSYQFPSRQEYLLWNFSENYWYRIHLPYKLRYQ